LTCLFPESRIDIPVKLKDLKTVYSISALVLEGESSMSLGRCDVVPHVVIQ
jgi:hypothetical protein